MNLLIKVKNEVKYVRKYINTSYFSDKYINSPSFVSQISKSLFFAILVHFPILVGFAAVFIFLLQGVRHICKLSRLTLAKYFSMIFLKF